MLTVSVERAKITSGREVDIFLTFTSKTREPLWIIPGHNARVADDLKNEYKWVSSEGFNRDLHELSASNDDRNKFLKLDQNVRTPATLHFRCAESAEHSAKRPTSVFFAADITIVTDPVSRSHEDKSLSVADLPIQ